MAPRSSEIVTTDAIDAAGPVTGEDRCASRRAFGSRDDPQHCNTRASFMPPHIAAVVVYQLHGMALNSYHVDGCDAVNTPCCSARQRSRRIASDALCGIARRDRVLHCSTDVRCAAAAVSPAERRP